ncbi:MAG: hypothetical protein NW201_13345 [Gemmatimonadales bacterium]|nr:hypothetical protein [Gemmatimonadales bacterium]
MLRDLLVTAVVLVAAQRWAATGPLGATLAAPSPRAHLVHLPVQDAVAAAPDDWISSTLVALGTSPALARHAAEARGPEITGPTAFHLTFDGASTDEQVVVDARGRLLLHVTGHPTSRRQAMRLAGALRTALRSPR